MNNINTQLLLKQSQSTTQLLRNQSKVSDFPLNSTSSLINHSFPTSKSMDLSYTSKVSQTNDIIQGEEHQQDVPIKICLREKKRERQISATEQERWRSSTTILDSLYKDLSKSILTIDDV